VAADRTLTIRLSPPEKESVQLIREHLRHVWPGSRPSMGCAVRYALSDLISALQGEQEQAQPKPAACRRR
jgi:hypothetical protein